MTQASKARPLRYRFLAIIAAISLFANAILFYALAALYRNINGMDQLTNKTTYMVIYTLGGLSLGACIIVSIRSVFYKAIFRQPTEEEGEKTE